MGQVEVLRFLKEHPDRWFTSFEIRERFGFAQSSITTVLRKLRKYGLVELKQHFSLRLKRRKHCQAVKFEFFSNFSPLTIYKEIRTPAVAYLYRAKM